MRRNILLTLFFALLFAATLQAQSNSGANDSQLQGNYAFSFTGVTSNGSISNAYAAVGRFTADGAGNLSNGELDANTVGAGASTAQPFTGTYSIGPDNRGLMTMNIGGSIAKLAFAMTANGNARFIKFDAAGGSGTIGSGTIELADSTAYSTSRISGDYALGIAGFDNLNNRAAILSRFTANGAGTLGNAAGDLNGYGTPYTMSFSSATYTVSDTTHGRGTMNLAFTFGGAPANLNFVFYVVNAGKVFVMARDVVTSSTPLLTGTLLQQHGAGSFSAASLNGNMVIYLTGSSACGSGSGVPKAVAGLLTAAGNGSLSLTYDENYCRAPGGIAGFAGTYTVASNGRATITLGGYHLVAYLVGPNEFFHFVSDANVLFGYGEPQTAGSYTNSSLKGSYAGSATNPVDFAVNVFSGEFSANGAGSMTGTEDMGRSSGTTYGAAFNATNSVTASPTNGRGTMTLGSGGTAVIYMISPSKFVVVPLSDPDPSVWIFEGASATTPPPPPPTATLSAISANPASVVGGSQSSTGTVSLSAPAPAGGAIVALSSSNTAVATVPSSVSVAAGATTASFTIATRVVASSTTVSISASYAGVTKSASLTVTPPPVTVSSLTLNPSSVMGGVQSSTGTVTLSGPAPAGGAQVALSSNNSAAHVPATVTVPAGATTASFTVSTSIVLFSTSATITASYNSTSRSATLFVY